MGTFKLPPIFLLGTGRGFWSSSDGSPVMDPRGCIGGGMLGRRGAGLFTTFLAILGLASPCVLSSLGGSIFRRAALLASGSWVSLGASSSVSVLMVDDSDVGELGRLALSIFGRVLEICGVDASGGQAGLSSVTPKSTSPGKTSAQQLIKPSTTDTTKIGEAEAMSSIDGSPSDLAHRRLGPRTIAILLGVILLTSWCSPNFAKNLIRNLRLL